MSPGSGVKSEYMKRYREPRWDEYGPCYRELLHYRLGRRLLEQTHAPWLWDDWGPASASDESASSSSSASSASVSGAGAPPAPPCARTWTPPPPPPPPPPSAVTAVSAPREEPEPQARGAAEERGAEAPGAGGEGDAELPALPVTDVNEKPEEIGIKESDKSSSRIEPRQQPSALFAKGSRKTVKSPQRSSKIKEKHPFALYGWGEKQTDTGSQKTHNVCASAPVHEIHESALRAKNRRQVEKRRLVTQRQRAHSVEVEKNRKVKSSSSENPWMTEYMRCYSARA